MLLGRMQHGSEMTADTEFVDGDVSMFGRSLISRSQWAKAASSHQLASFCIASLCGDAITNDLIAAMSRQSVSVRKRQAISLTHANAQVAGRAGRLAARSMGAQEENGRRNRGERR